MTDQVVQQQVGFAPEIAKYGQDVLGQAWAATDMSDPANAYKSYASWAQSQGLTGDQTAQFQQLQKTAFDKAQNLGVADSSLQSAYGLKSLADRAAGQGNYLYANQGSAYNTPANLGYNAANSSAAMSGAAPQTQAAIGQYQNNLQNYQMGGPQQVQAKQFGQPQADQYMSPYMQSVVAQQQRDAQRQADIATTTRNADATGKGAFGGSRQAIMDAEAARNLALQKGDIQAQGSQAAYQSAQQQFNADQNAALQAQQANQGAGLTTGTQNLNALLSTQQLGSGYGQQMAMQNLQNQQQANQANQAMQGQYGLANQANQQQTNLANQNSQNQAMQFGAQQNLANAQTAAQYGLSAQQLNSNQQQFGANYGLQNLNAALSGYGALGSQGQNIYGQQTGTINLQDQLGAQQQQQVQNALNTNYSNYQNEMNYPYKQLGFMSDIVRGSPMSVNGTNTYGSSPSNLQTVAGLAGLGMGMTTKASARGGSIKSKYGGLNELALSSMG